MNDKSSLSAITDNIAVQSLFDQRMVETILSTHDALSCYTAGRTFKINRWVNELGTNLKFDDISLKELEISAMFCDIGMWAIPQAIINKNGRLTLQEFRIVQEHPQLTLKALESISISEDVALNILHHHESFDGSGYPNRLREDEIPKGAQIINVTCALYSLTSERPYREPVSVENAVAIITKEEGKQFHPDVVNSLKALYSSGKLCSVAREGFLDPFSQLRKELKCRSENTIEQAKRIATSNLKCENDSRENDSLQELRKEIGKTG